MFCMEGILVLVCMGIREFYGLICLFMSCVLAFVAASFITREGERDEGTSADYVCPVV